MLSAFQNKWANIKGDGILYFIQTGTMQGGGKSH